MLTRPALFELFAMRGVFHELDLAARLGEAGEIIVPAGRAFGTAPLRLGGVLDLVADRHLEPGADQAGAIGFGGVDRDAGSTPDHPQVVCRASP